MTSIGVAIGTFGDRDAWEELADRALASVDRQLRPADDFCWVHADTLQHARNQAADSLNCDYLIFLDADDELDEAYLAAMAEFASDEPAIYRPATLGVYEDGSEDDESVMIPRRDLQRANFIVIGAMCPRDTFFEVGGFDDYPILEDWALWRKMVRAGTPVYDVPEAVYRVHVREESRNQDHQLHGEIYRRIMTEVPL